jgi:hypothetical protein
MDSWKYVVVEAELRSATCLGMTVYTGKKMKIVDRRTGREIEQDRHHWLSRKFTLVQKAWLGPDGEHMVEIRVPEWLARHEGIH